MGDATKVCPECAETIQAGAILCRFCKADLSGRPAAPPPPARRKGGPVVLVVIVVVGVLVVGGGVLAALLLPAVARATRMAHQGTAEHLVDQLSQAAKHYELDWAVYPPGEGSDSRGLSYVLARPGPKRIPYFDFAPDMLRPDGNVVNPVWPDAPPPQAYLYYRNNAARTGGAGAPPVFNRSSFDLWCAGADFDVRRPATQWSVNNWR